MSTPFELEFRQPVPRWDEAIALGNGLLGCLIWGDGHPFRFSLDRGDLWDTRVAGETLRTDFTYRQLVQLVRNGRQDEILIRFDRFYGKPTPTKIPAGRLELDIPVDLSFGGSRLYLDRAEGTLAFTESGRRVELRAFMHATRNLGFILLHGRLRDFSLRLKAPRFSRSGLPKNAESPPNAAWLLDYPDPVYREENGIALFHQKTKTGLEYAVVAGRRPSAYGAEICYTVAANRDGENWLEAAVAAVREALNEGYEEAFKTHRKWWRAFWDKSGLDLPDKDAERQWNLANYYLGSCSRKGAPPAPLQGVWTADEDRLPPWKGDYHHDLNTQMTYWHYSAANHMEEGESFTDFLWEHLPAAKDFAQRFFEAPGAVYPAVMSIDGKPLGGWPQYCLNLVNQAWLCQAFVWHARYSADEGFLRDRAYPFLEAAAETIAAWLEPGKDGKLRLPVSSSPEVHDNRIQAWVTPNSNNDLALLLYLFGQVRDLARRLGHDPEAARWEDLLSRLPELAVTDHGVLKISPDESLQESHRHLGHLMAIYPLRLITCEGGPDQKRIIDASIAQLERLGTGLWVGFSFAWMACLYACQGNGRGALTQLKLFWEHLCSPNGFHLNGDYRKAGITAFHYRPFTLESNMGAAAALQEMLLQSWGDVLRVFPAVPDDWETLSFHNLRAEGAVLVSARREAGRLVEVVLRPEKDLAVGFKNAFPKPAITVESDTGHQRRDVPLGEVLPLTLKAGETCRLTCP